MEASLDLQEEMLEILEGVTDKESAKEAAEDIKELTERAQELAKKVAELPEPSAEEIKEMTEKYKGRMEEIQKRMMAAMQPILQYPELSQAMQKANADLK